MGGLTNSLVGVRNGAQTLRDVKNEGTSGDVYENKGADDIMSRYCAGFLQKIQGFRGNSERKQRILTGNGTFVGREAEKCGGPSFVSLRTACGSSG